MSESSDNTSLLQVKGFLQAILSKCIFKPVLDSIPIFMQETVFHNRLAQLMILLLFYFLVNGIFISERRA